MTGRKKSKPKKSVERADDGRPVDWPAAAEALAAAFPRERLDASVVRWAAERSRREAWAVAFSGGADSLALLLLLWAHWPERRARLRALHFDHRLRGAESRADAAFCRRVAAALGIPCVSEIWRRPRGSPPPSEAEARTARHAFFARHARIVWLGHQQDDIAETFFMRLARGSGTAGLAAPRPVQALPGRRLHVRPLLSLKKAELVAALRRAGIPWREDSTNAAGDYFRNRVRRDVLPVWIAAAQRDALAGAARSRELLAEDDAALEALLDAADVLDPKRGELNLAALAGKPRALWRRALHRWFGSLTRSPEISRQAFEALLDAIQQGRKTRHSLGVKGFAVSDGACLRFELGRKTSRSFRRRAN